MKAGTDDASLSCSPCVERVLKNVLYVLPGTRQDDDLNI